jgi:hypothetical protein
VRYTVKRIGLGSALRVGLALGWLVALFPSLTLAWLALAALRRVDDALGQITPYELSVLGQPIAQLDLLQLLGLVEVVRTIARLAGDGWQTFLTITGLLTLAGAAIVVVTLLAFCLCYNLLAATVGGLKIELEAP